MPLRLSSFRPRRAIPVLLLLAGAGAAASRAAAAGAAPPTAGATPLTDRFDPQAEPWAFPLPPLPRVEGVGASASAAACGACHQAIYAEWRRSTHAHALSDLQFQAEIAKPDNPRWLCLNCHIPLADQRRRRVTGLRRGDLLQPLTEPNPRFDPDLRAEAITCAVCHVRRAADGSGYILGPVGSGAAPHPVRAAATELRAICLRCHDPQGAPLTPNLFCWFTTRAELQAPGGAWADSAAAAPGDRYCGDCHMPRATRLVAESNPQLEVRPVHRHTWAGGGVPKVFSGFATRREDGWRPGVALQPQWVARAAPGNRAADDHPGSRARGTTTGHADHTGHAGPELCVTLHQNGAGHAVPTADPERALWVRVAARDANGDTLYYRAERIGQTWSWNPARKLGDNRLQPGEDRLLHFFLPPALGHGFPPTPWPAGVTLAVEALHVRLSSANARGMRDATGVDPEFAPAVAELDRHYPLAAYLYRATWSPAERCFITAPGAVLDSLSRAEAGKGLDGARGY